MSSSKRARGPAVKPKSGKEGKSQLTKDSHVVFVKRAFTHSKAAELFKELKALEYARRELTVYGKKSPEPRCVRYEGASPELTYSYSGVTLTPEPFSPVVLGLLKKVKELFPEAPHFNTVLLNFYQTGEDHLAYHSDYDEKRYGTAPVIASLSFGAERDFILRRKDDKDDKTVFALGAGAALLMAGACQTEYEHSVPARKSSGVVGRINLTFRYRLPPA